MSDPSRVRIIGPLEPFAAGFASELARQGYVPRVIVHHLGLMAGVSRWLTDQDLQVADLASAAARVLQARRAAGYTRYWPGRALRPRLTYLRHLGVVAPTPAPVFTDPVDVMLARYRHYLTGERGLGAATARGYVDAVRPFLRTRLSPDGLHLDLKHLCGADVTAFVVALTPTQSPHAAKMTVCSLRSILQFWHLDGAITPPLVAAVPSVAGWRLAGLPQPLKRGVRHAAPAGLLRSTHGRRLARFCDSAAARACRAPPRRSRRPPPRRPRLAAWGNRRARQRPTRRAVAAPHRRRGGHRRVRASEPSLDRTRPGGVRPMPGSTPRPDANGPHAGCRGGCPAGRSRDDPCAPIAPFRGNAGAPRWGITR
jgi:hypothetical protein